MSVPHDKVSPSTRILTTKTRPDNEEMQLRLKLLKHDGYEIDESKNMTKKFLNMVMILSFHFFTPNLLKNLYSLSLT